MKHHLKRIALSVGSVLVLFAPLAFSAVATAAAPPPAPPCNQSNNQPNIAGCLDSGTCLNTGETACAVPSANDSVNNIIATVINIFSLVVGVVAVIMIIIGGLKYITSSGDSSNITGAKNTILYAIIGLVIVALAQVIVRFVLGKASPTPTQ